MNPEYVRYLHCTEGDAGETDLPFLWVSPAPRWVRQVRVAPRTLGGRYVPQTASDLWARFETPFERRFGILKSAEDAELAEATILLCFAESGLVPADVAGLIAAVAAWLLG